MHPLKKLLPPPSSSSSSSSPLPNPDHCICEDEKALKSIITKNLGGQGTKRSYEGKEVTTERNPATNISSQAVGTETVPEIVQRCKDLIGTTLLYTSSGVAEQVTLHDVVTVDFSRLYDKESFHSVGITMDEVSLVARTSEYQCVLKNDSDEEIYLDTDSFLRLCLSQNKITN